jgi:hypothetical protein
LTATGGVDFAKRAQIAQGSSAFDALVDEEVDAGICLLGCATALPATIRDSSTAAILWEIFMMDG